MTDYPSDLEIANAAYKKPIDEIASVLDIDQKNLIKFGYVLKLNTMKPISTDTFLVPNFKSTV